MNNLNNGLMFGIEGPNMEGTWYNPQTGDSFTVRNSFFEDNQYLVQTTDGRILRYDQIQHYIQSDHPIETVKSKQVNDTLPNEVINLLEDETSTDSQASTNYLLPEDEALLHSPKTLGNLAQSTGFSQIIKDTHATTINFPESNVEDFSIIEKALGKKSLPEIEVDIDWKNFPRKEIDMLYDVMEIPAEHVIKWYFSKIDKTYVVERLKRAIEDYIFSQITPVEQESVLLETLPVLESTVEKIEDLKPVPSQKKITTKKSTQKTTSKSKSKK